MNRIVPRILPAAAVLLLVLLADTAAWWWLSGRVITFYERWRAAREAEGVVITTGPVSRGGWPFQATAIVPDITIAADSSPRSARWHAEQLHLVYVPWRPRSFTASVAGAQTLGLGDLTAIPINGQLNATLPLDPAKLGQARIEGHAIAVTLPRGTAEVQGLALQLSGAEARLALDGMVWPRPLGSLPFGGRVEAVSLNARTSAPLVPAGSAATTLAAWREAGGELALSDIRLHWGPLDAAATATLTLDSALQPQGSGNVRLTGYADMIDALRASGILSPSSAMVAATMLGLVSQPAGEGDRIVELPLTLKNQTLAIGAVPLFHVPKVTFP